MIFVFLDEAGYTSDWITGASQQPYYALSAVCIPAEQLRTSYSDTRAMVGALVLVQYPSPLGHGFEIKAREIASGGGWWQTHNNERNAVRDAMLLAPPKVGGCVFVMVMDKRAHIKKYKKPQDPYMLAFQFIFERLVHYLNSKNDRAYVIYDQNTRLQESILGKAAALLHLGATVPAFSWFHQRYFDFNLDMDRILEVSLGDSKHSLGLQYADYFATFTYCYFRDGKPAQCGWWNTLVSSLHQYNGQVDGVGLKLFPQ